MEQMEFVGKLKKLDISGNATDAENGQSMFALTVLEKELKKQD